MKKGVMVKITGGESVSVVSESFLTRYQEESQPPNFIRFRP